jgi:hypothetical protein
MELALALAYKSVCLRATRTGDDLETVIPHDNQPGDLLHQASARVLATVKEQRHGVVARESVMDCHVAQSRQLAEGTLERNLVPKGCEVDVVGA